MTPTERSRAQFMSALMATLSLSLAAGCTSSSSSGASASGGPCDPLAPPPTTLSGVLGVGQDAQGTLYVADSPPDVPQARVFVSGGGQLLRQVVVGSGESGGGQYTLGFEAPGGTNVRALLLDVQGGAASQMALGPADSKSFLGGPGETTLTVVDPGTVAGLTIVNLPGVVSYVADVSDGTSIVVTSPMQVESSSDFHLFYGQASAMVERTIVNFDQALSGYPSIAFQVGSATYTMSISGSSNPDAGTGPGPGTLSTGSTTLAFTLRSPTPTTLSGFSFTCL